MEFIFNNVLFVAIGVLVLAVLLVLGLTFVFKGTGKKTAASSHKATSLIDPVAMIKEIFMAAPSEQKTIRQNYLGQRVELRAILNKISISYEDKSLRDLLLNYEQNHSISIVGTIDIGEYKDRSWMQKGGKVNVIGEMDEIQENRIKLRNLRILQ